VYFSSFGQFLGLPGQASYATANAFLDGLARHHRATGDAAVLSLCWTSWRDLGMAVNDVVAHELAANGVGDISANEAFRCWEAASRGQTAQVCVFPTRPLDDGARPRPILGELTFGDAGEPADAAPDDFADLPPDLLRERVRHEVARQVGAEVRIPADELDADLTLSALGVDSVLTLAIRRRLDKRFRLSLPSTLIWGSPTISGLTDYLVGQLGDEESVHAV
jgi:6-methylsalicylic acid synthase